VIWIAIGLCIGLWLLAAGLIIYALTKEEPTRVIYATMEEQDDWQWPARKEK
jgi:hypothetical protein